ncbi:hypothetical protein QOZ80_2AG0147280 [Eleusine coracana subsp. coracana]|nr:hypothetical protein QOZ80_2AG0147190 [Eleusine coracana subsp. coracana]KAK3159219.1 hypothetical protein QOZ80_2AG0147280 [Eleusine coracana subsp. coracana]
MAELRAFVAAAYVMVAVLVSVAPLGAEAKTTIEPCSGSDWCSALLGYTLYADMKSVSVRYAARPADTLADVAFAGLASADQIRDENGLTAADPDAPLDAGRELVVPLPCVCFNASDNNLPAMYLSYVVQVGDTVPAIAATYETTVTDVMNVNAMGSPVAAPGEVLAIPLPACASTFPKSSSDHGLIVANGTYALTAGNCVQCSCGPNSLNLYCTYRGFVNGTITASLDTGLQPRCPGPHQFPALTNPPTTVNHDSTYLPPLSAPAPAEAGGVIPAPDSSVQGGSFTLPKVSTANGPAGSVSEAPSTKKPRPMLFLFILCLVFYSM